jgi:hypothetical protein
MAQGCQGRAAQAPESRQIDELLAERVFRCQHRPQSVNEVISPIFS